MEDLSPTVRKRTGRGAISRGPSLGITRQRGFEHDQNAFDGRGTRRGDLGRGIAASQTAEAAWRCGPHGRVCVHRHGAGGIGPAGAAALGVVGGVALGAAIASAAQPVYAAPAPVYLAPPPPACVVHKDRIWTGWAWEVRTREVCR
jgi:hypothetical protein